MGVLEVAVNRRAKFEYFIEDAVEAGISLTGAEVKSAKLGHMNIGDSFCFIDGGTLVLKNCRISPYEKSSHFALDPARDRVLLLHRSELNKFFGKVREKGYTLVPLRAYFKGRFLKIEIGLCRGKHTYDKKRAIKERDISRAAERDIRDYTGRG